MHALYTALSKEFLEMHVDGQSFLLDDYKSLTSFGTTGTVRTRTQEKGHRASSSRSIKWFRRWTTEYLGRAVEVTVSRRDRP